MADGDDDFYDDDFYYEDDYLYVEDSYAAADELAETSVPSPPPYERIDDDYSGYDHYDYWMDIEYGDDEYYDVSLQMPGGLKACSQSQKRKARNKDNDNDRRPSKLSKHSHPGGLSSSEQAWIWRGPNVVYMQAGDMHKLDVVHAPVARRVQKYALLPDWRKRFPSAKNTSSSGVNSVPMTAMMDEQAVNQDLNEDLEEEEEDGDNDGEEDAGAQLDPAVLMSILQSKLGSMGGDGAHLQAMLGDMLSHCDGDLEEVLEKLTNAVLEKVDEGGTESGIGQWLAHRGVKLPPTGDEDGQHGLEAASDSPASNGAKNKTAKRADSGATGTPDGNASQPNMPGSTRKPQPAQPGQMDDEDKDQQHPDNLSVTNGKKRKAEVEALPKPAKKQSREHAPATDSSKGKAVIQEPSTTRPRRKRK